MNFTHKILVLVALQIILIITSFLIIVYFESQTALTGNRVNIAGKNRVLTSLVHVNMIQSMYSGADDVRVVTALEDLEENIMFLRDGGMLNDIEIPPLPSEFVADWGAVWTKFTAYDSVIRSSLSDLNLDDVDQVMNIDTTNLELVGVSDSLTRKLGDSVDDLSDHLIMLQITLGIVNVMVHVFMIIFVLRIFKSHTEQKIKTERFTTIGQFASLMAHDLRNPLGAIRNSLVIITGRNDGNNEVIDSECSRIDRSINRMAHQIDGVMHYARNVPLFTKSCSMCEIIHRSMETINIPENIDTKFPENDTAITCDSTKMEFVFTNLMLNAIQAIGSNKGSITIRLTDRPAEIALEFENSGPAIPEENLQRIFEPLFTTKMQGTGLGLVSCTGIVQRHGGHITVRNDPVTFTVVIPKEGI